MREDELDQTDEEVHGVDVHEGVVADVPVLDLDGHHLTSVFQLGPVDLSKAGYAKRFLLKFGKQF